MNSPLKNIIPVLLLALISCKNPSDNPSLGNKILVELEHLNTGNMPSDQKCERLGQLYEKIPSLKNDSTKNRILLNISYHYLELKDSAKFRRINSEAYQNALKQKDSVHLALAYWDRAGFFYRYNIMDSAFYALNQVQKIYGLMGNNYRSGRALLDMGIIQQNIHDYTGSEVTTIQAISYLEPLDEYWYLYRGYNNLGIVYKELEEYDQSFSYYQTAGEYLDKAGREDKYPSLWNNMGVMFKNSDRHERAASYFDKALKHDPEALKTDDPELYAMLLDNQAHNRFETGDTLKLLPQFKKALAIREKEEIVAGVIVSKLHLAEYFRFKEDTATAIHHALQAKKLARDSQNYRDVLASLLMLSKLDRKNHSEYTERYIQLNDSLHQQERETRDKFARIRYETAGYIAQTEKLSGRIIWVLLVSGGIVLVLGLTVMLIVQNFRNKRVQLIHQGRETEKKRIARELHDGIVGKLYGSRQVLDVLNEKDDHQAKDTRLRHIKEIQKLEVEIRSLSHELGDFSPIHTQFEVEVKALVEGQEYGTTQFELNMEQNIDFQQIEPDIKLNLYRIIQESIQNIHKHAQADKATISIQQRRKRLSLSIADNGKGIDFSKTGGGIGLKNIRERTKNIGGKLTITPNKAGQKGTKIKITLKTTPYHGKQKNDKSPDGR